MTRRILIDENIPGAEACFQQFGDVRLFSGRHLQARDVKDADALVVRSVTRVNADLLTGSRVAFVGSATIGTDHLDMSWLQAEGIHWCNAPASNAESVVDYCLSAYCALDGVLETLLDGGRVGIIGFGNVGTRLYQRLSALGITCLAYDPLLPAGQCPVSASLSEVLACDVLSMHTPLTVDGLFPTFQMLSVAELCQLPPGGVILNAGRGEVLPNRILKKVLNERGDLRLVLDVWEGEPAIDRDLARQVAIATPHIAGYSSDGKLRGLQMVAEQYARFLGCRLHDFQKPRGLQDTPELVINHHLSGSDWVRAVVRACYDVREDDQRLREVLAGDDHVAGFDRLRRHYPVRRELSACKMASETGLTTEQRELLRALGVGV